MVLIPEGEFSPRSYSHPVSIDSLYFGIHPVTNLQYDRFIEETNYASQDNLKSAIDREERKKEADKEDLKFENLPVCEVSWNDANQYCSWAGVRLPTVFEWEYAAQGKDGRSYPWGEKWDPSVCHNSVKNPKEYARTTAPVWDYPAGCSPFGLYQMSGNVFEWTRDPIKGDLIVIKGGSWHDLRKKDYLVSNRTEMPKNGYAKSIGFRVVKSMVNT